MAKSKLTTKRDPEAYDFMNYFEESLPDEAMLGVMSGFVEASRYQQQYSIELTKLIVEKSQHAALSEEEILSIFKRVSQVVTESTPLNKLLEKM